MQQLEYFPQSTGIDVHEQQEDIEQQQRLDIEVAELHLGNTALHGAVETQQDIEDDTELLEAYANGVDVRPEDAGRVLDVDAAHDEAITENDIIEAHQEALRENEMYDLHSAAIEEDRARHIAELETNDEQVDAVEPDQVMSDAPNIAKDSDETIKPSSDDYSKQAEQALKDAGLSGKIAEGSQVTKDYENDSIVITDNVRGTVQIVEPIPGGGNRIVEYSFDKTQGTIIIKADGVGAITARVGEYTPTNDGEHQPGDESIILPSAVAKLVGAKRAVPVAAR